MTATHTLNLNARAFLTPRTRAMAALQRLPIAYPNCCCDPECDESAAWGEYLTLALAGGDDDLALARWTIAKRECLIRQADAGMRTWASVGEFLGRMGNV